MLKSHFNITNFFQSMVISKAPPLSNFAFHIFVIYITWGKNENLLHKFKGFKGMEWERSKELVTRIDLVLKACIVLEERHICFVIAFTK